MSWTSTRSISHRMLDRVILSAEGEVRVPTTVIQNMTLQNYEKLRDLTGGEGGEGKSPFPDENRRQQKQAEEKSEYGSDPKAVGRECAGMKETGPPPLVDSNGVLTPEIVCNTSATNCIPNTGGMLNKIFGGYSWIDIISSWAAGLLPSQPVPDHLKGKDMCMWNYQSLPPPPGPTKGVPYARQRLALGLQAVHSCH